MWSGLCGGAPGGASSRRVSYHGWSACCSTPQPIVIGLLTVTWNHVGVAWAASSPHESHRVDHACVLLAMMFTRVIPNCWGPAHLDFLLDFESTVIPHEHSGSTETQPAAHLLCLSAPQQSSSHAHTCLAGPGPGHVMPQAHCFGKVTEPFRGIDQWLPGLNCPKRRVRLRFDVSGVIACDDV